MEDQIKALIKKILNKLIPIDTVDRAITLAERLSANGIHGANKLDEAVNNLINKLPISLRPFVFMFKTIFIEVAKEIIQERFDEIKDEINKR